MIICGIFSLCVVEVKYYVDRSRSRFDFRLGESICGMFAFHTNVGTLMVVSTIS